MEAVKSQPVSEPVSPPAAAESAQPTIQIAEPVSEAPRTTGIQTSPAAESVSEVSADTHEAYDPQSLPTKAEAPGVKPEWPVPVLPKVNERASSPDLQLAASIEAAAQENDMPDVPQPEELLDEAEPQADDALEATFEITQEPLELVEKADDTLLELGSSGTEENVDLDAEQDPAILIDAEGDSDDQTFVIPEQFVISKTVEIPFNVTPAEIKKAVVATEESLQATLDEVLKPLEPEAAQAVTELVDSLAELAIDIQNAPEEELPEKKIELQEMLSRVLQTMAVEYDEETIEKFISSILLEGLELPDNSEDDASWDPGTHEKKIISYLIIRNLSLLTDNRPKFSKIGQYVLSGLAGHPVALAA